VLKLGLLTSFTEYAQKDILDEVDVDVDFAFTRQ